MTPARKREATNASETERERTEREASSSWRDTRWLGESPLTLLDTLSPREREILALVAAYSTNKEIAARQCLSLNTVQTHMSHILRKLCVSDRREASRLLWAQKSLVTRDVQAK